MSELLVIGHRNPDTDSICSAIGYAEFKRRTGSPNAVAARCGDTNDRIDFVLKTFGAQSPKFVSDVSPRVRDVMETNVVSAYPESTIAEALSLMDERTIRVLPILDKERICKGLLSVFKMSKFFFPPVNRAFDSRRVLASIRNLAKTLNAKMVFAMEPDREEDLILMIGAMSLESFAKRLPTYPHDRLVVIVGDRQEIQQRAIRERVRMVIITGGLPLEREMIEAARRNEVSVLLAPYDTATSAMLCRGAISVKHMVHEQFVSFKEDELVEDIEGRAAAATSQAFPVIDNSQRTVGILSKSDFLKKVDRRLILVDHNELTQAVKGADRVEIVEIIDHHRIGVMTTSQPILFRNEPVGSTSTIVADCFFRENIELPKSLAGLLLAGLVSDTLNLSSPTTTKKDVLILAELEKISGVNATQFTEKLFASGSVLIARPAEQAITTDCKEYAEEGRLFSVAQIEEIGFDHFWKRKDEVLKALQKYQQEKNYFFSALLVTDVVKQTSVLVIVGAPEYLRQIDYRELEEGFYELSGVVSRKKQLLPYLTHCLEQLKHNGKP